MKDLIVIAMTIAFFGLSVGYVALCNRIIGPDEPSTAGDAGESDDDIGDSDIGDPDLGGDAGDRRVAEVDA